MLKESKLRNEELEQENARIKLKLKVLQDKDRNRYKPKAIDQNYNQLLRENIKLENEVEAIKGQNRQLMQTLL